LARFLPVSGVFSFPAYIYTDLINVPKIGVKTIFYNRAQYEHSYNALVSGMVRAGMVKIKRYKPIQAFLHVRRYFIP
jgi:hypothetical protein